MTTTDGLYCVSWGRVVIGETSTRVTGIFVRWRCGLRGIWVGLVGPLVVTSSRVLRYDLDHEDPVLKFQIL